LPTRQQRINILQCFIYSEHVTNVHEHTNTKNKSKNKSKSQYVKNKQQSKPETHKGIFKLLRQTGGPN